MHDKNDIIRKLLAIIEESTLTEIHEDHCQITNYKGGPCNCLLERARTVVAEAREALRE